MVAAGGAGALVASLIIAVRQTRQWGGGIPFIGHFAVFLGVFGVTALGLADTWTLAMLSVAVCGFCGTMIGINMQSTIQLNVDDAYRGRVMSLVSMQMNAAQLGTFVIGLASEAIGPRWAFAGMGAALVLMSAWFTLWFSPMRRLQ